MLQRQPRPDNIAPRGPNRTRTHAATPAPMQTDRIALPPLVLETGKFPHCTIRVSLLAHHGTTAKLTGKLTGIMLMSQKKHLALLLYRGALITKTMEGYCLMSSATLHRFDTPKHQPPSSSLHKRNFNPLEHAAYQQLLRNGRQPLCGVRCNVNGSTARLSGTLPTFFLKQMAQEVIRKIDGIHRIENCIKVVYEEAQE